jgi:hypothetical protein
VCITVLLLALAGRPHPRAWPPPNGGWITVQKDHDQDCNNPDQEKPIHDDKEPCVTSHTTPSTMSTARKFPLPNG